MSNIEIIGAPSLHKSFDNTKQTNRVESHLQKVILGLALT